MRARVGLSLVVVFLLAAFAALAAIEPRLGEIKGTVTDGMGGVLPGATVTLRGPEARTAITSAKGEFSFPYLTPGAYTVIAELAGFSRWSMNVTVSPGATARVSVQMPLSSLQETVTVTGNQPVTRRGETAVTQGVSGGVAGAIVGGIAAAPPPGVAVSAPFDPPAPYRRPFNTSAYDHLDENPFFRVSDEPLSTFSIDVDTASYANVRRFINSGSLPPAGAVRIEELINYFRFDYPQPAGDAPFSITTSLVECPWNSKNRLALIGLQGRSLADDNVPDRNLVFLLDVSGSMNQPDKLPLVQRAMQMLVNTLTARDRVAIVVYAGASGMVLPSTPGDHKETINAAIGNLRPGGSTNGAAGIRLAYQIAREQFVRGGVNRVVLATDGDFNVGVTSQDELVRLIEQERASGIFLSVLGVGTDNLKDSTMEKLADKGNGNYAYLDSLREAQKVLVREAGSTLVTIAKDVKIQIEFNPSAVAAYRLIGYENRVLQNQDFNDDTKDAGEIGAGHSVTALYEIVPSGEDVPLPSVDPLKYQRPAQHSTAAASDELLTVKLRYKDADGDSSRLVSSVIRRTPQPITANIGFASAVAEFGMLLRNSKHAGTGSFSSAAARARMFRGEDREGYRAEFVSLVDLVNQLSLGQTAAHADGAR
jgi:Ca-activated chloride channel homolog